LAWRIEITRTAAKQITKFHRDAQKAILRFLPQRVASAEDPHQWGKPLRGEKRGLCYRVGDYRLICDIQDEIITVVVLEVSHWKDLYR
jgi:mRNA interferase RelE/StbE